MALLSLQNISKHYGATVAVDALSLSIERGEIFGLLGPSGCGKTTTLRMILGLAPPDSGLIEFEGRDITSVPVEQRGFGMVFQNYALFTNMNVFENVAFGMKVHSSDEADIGKRVESFLAFVRLPGYEERRISELSAGQQQRVAIARAIAQEPPILLFDEPLANLDIGLRNETGWEIRKLIKQLNLTALYVTHDQAEAFKLCDRIGIMSDGRMLQTGTPRDVYERPSSASVAQFLGFNLLQAVRLGAVQNAVIAFKTVEGEHILQAHVGLNELPSDRTDCILAFRPEDISITSNASSAGNILRVAVREVLFGGAMTTLKLDAGGLRFDARLLRVNAISPGDDCLVEIPPDRISVLPLNDAM